MLKFLCGKNNFLTPAPNCLLCNVLIQPPFDYTCSAWHPVLIRKLKHRIHTTQIKCIRYCLYFDNLKHISHEEFEHLNWLPVTYKFKKSVSSIFLSISLIKTLVIWIKSLISLQRLIFSLEVTATGLEPTSTTPNLSVRLQFKWSWVRVSLPSFKFQIPQLFQTRSSLTFRPLQDTDST